MMSSPEMGLHIVNLKIGTKHLYSRKCKPIIGLNKNCKQILGRDINWWWRRGREGPAGCGVGI
jgi:hypothetical protein